MPPRYAYWTIIAGGLPTAFRAAEREELLPTFQRIKEKHPDAQMKYFARGKLWESQDAARAVERRGGRPRADQPGRDKDARNRPRSDEASANRDRRGRDWRPGGEHRDPRQKFIDAKKQRNAAMRKERWQRKNVEGVRDQVSGFRGGQGDRPQGRPQGGRPQGFRPQGSSPFGSKPQGMRPEGAKPRGARPHGERPHGNRPQGGRPQAKRPFDDRRPWERKPWPRAQGTEEPRQPPKPRGPNREPRPDEVPEPTPPPRPEQPITPPPGPPERGDAKPRRPFQARNGFGRKPFPKGPRKR